MPAPKNTSLDRDPWTGNQHSFERQPRERHPRRQDPGNQQWRIFVLGVVAGILLLAGCIAFAIYGMADGADPYFPQEIEITNNTELPVEVSVYRNETYHTIGGSVSSGCGMPCGILPGAIETRTVNRQSPDVQGPVTVIGWTPHNFEVIYKEVVSLQEMDARDWRITITHQR